MGRDPTAGSPFQKSPHIFLTTTFVIQIRSPSSIEHPVNLKESWRLANIHSRMGSIKVLHGNPRKSNRARN
jgi:hypothetical protein